MKIIQITSRHRYDYSAILQCEHCGSHQSDPSGYDDINYHVNVMPRMACLKCGKDRAGNNGGITKGVLMKPVETQSLRWVEA